MKDLLLIVLVVLIAGCKKEAQKDMPAPDIYPYTKLVGHTWEGLSYADSTGTPYYQFLNIKTETTVGIYTGVYDASRITEPEVDYTCKITAQANHQDLVEVFYP